MSTEAISMCKHLITATVRGEVNAQYHWAELLMLDAIKRGVKQCPPPIVPRCRQCGQRFEDFACGPTHALIKSNPSIYFQAEDAIEEARR